MRTIWKQVLKPDDYITIEVPRGSKFLEAKEQLNQPCVWYYVPDTDAPMEKRVLRMVRTGHLVKEPFTNTPSPLNYLGQIQLHGGNLIFHIFEVVVVN